MNSVYDEQTTRVKQQYYRSKLYILFDYILRSKGFWDGKDERPYSIDFKSIGLSDILQKDQLINSRLGNGTMSHIQAIQEYEGINEYNARKKLEAVEADMSAGLDNQTTIEGDRINNSLNVNNPFEDLI